MKILVTGSRDWKDWATILRALWRFPSGTELVHGAARGADRISGHIGEALGFAVYAHPANWTHLGRRAGPIRNAEMLQKHPDIKLVLAFPLPKSKGTFDMIEKARYKGIDVKITDG